jgi:hypothetical protein
MKTRNLVWAAIGSLALSGAALAQGGMGMKGGMGMMGDGDAKVTKEEFLKRAEERFARMDANQDGVIDASDRAAMRQRMQECMQMMDGMGMMGGGMGMMGGGMGAGTDANTEEHESHHPKP